DQALHNGSNFDDLATPDTVTFTLTATRDILVYYFSAAYCSALTPGIANASKVYLDGTAYADSLLAQTPTQTSGSLAHIFVYKIASVASGSHTISVKHASGVTTDDAHWLSRTTIVTLA